MTMNTKANIYFASLGTVFINSIRAFISIHNFPTINFIFLYCVTINIFRFL